MCANSIFSNFVGSIHVPWSTIPYSFFVLTVNIILNLVLIDQMGVIGAAISSVISFSLLIPFHYYYTMKYLNSEQNPSS